MAQKRLAAQQARDRMAAEQAARSHARERAFARADALGDLRWVASAVKTLGWIVVVLGSLAGIGLCIYHEDYPNDSHPLVGVGIAMLFWSLLIGAIVILSAHWADAWREMQS